MRLIDADELSGRMYHEAFEKDSDMQKWEQGCWIRYKVFENCLANTSTIDAEEIRYGEWIEDYNNTYKRCRMKCSACGKFSGIGGIKSNQNKPYCPNCGAKMRIK